MIDWMLRGPEIATCNCAYGCPCQFNALPTSGNCTASVAMRIDKGHFGDVRLDGLHWAGIFAWPGAVHEGRGVQVAQEHRQRAPAPLRMAEGEPVLQVGADEVPAREARIAAAVLLVAAQDRRVRAHDVQQRAVGEPAHGIGALE